MKPIYYLVIALLLIIGIGWYFWPDTSKQSERELELLNKVTIRDSAIHNLSREAEKEKQERKAEKLAYMDTVRTYKDRDKKITREIARIKANPVVIKVREEVPLIDSAFHAYDSLLESKDVQISLAEKRITKLEVDITEVEERFEEQLRLMGENVADLKSITEDQRKQLRKIRRQNRLVKVVAVVSAVGGLLLGGQL